MRSSESEDCLTWWRIIAETKGDICQANISRSRQKYSIDMRHVTYPGPDQCASLLPDIITLYTMLSLPSKWRKDIFIIFCSFSTVWLHIYVYGWRNVTERYYHCSEKFCSIRRLIHGPNYQHQQYKEQHHYWLLLWLRSHLYISDQQINSTHSIQHSAKEYFISVLLSSIWRSHLLSCIKLVGGAQ